MFGWAYALFEIPGGWLGDRIGPRRVLMRIVIWWSFFTAATGWAWNLTSLLVTRALFGVGEAGGFPNLTRVFTTWLPARSASARRRSSGWRRAEWGALTPLLVAYILRVHAWRRAFELFGVLGVDLGHRASIAGIATIRPRTRSVNTAELALLPPPSETAVAHGPMSRGGSFSRSPRCWLLCAQYICLAYGWWFYVTWLPTYLRDARGTAFKMGALLAGLPLLLGGIGCLVSAALIPRLATRDRQRRAGAAHRRDHRLRRRVGVDLHLHQHRGSDEGDVRAGHGGLLQRLRDAGGVGRAPWTSAAATPAPCRAR